jgi:hypothetical protein
MGEAVSEYRQLTDSEIQLLLSNNCTSENWSDIGIKPLTDISKCRNVNFTGKIRLGLFNSSFFDESGVKVQSGIVNAHLHNCTLGDNVSIYNIRDYIANYNIAENVVIRNCGRIHVEGSTSFGNGTFVAVLNETGTRAVRIWDRLSAQEAYVMALYRHRPEAIARIEELINKYSESVSSETGTIESGTYIHNCITIRNVKIGPYSRIDGAVKLSEGSVNSCHNDPVHIGHGVIMEHFIVCSGSVVDDSTLVDKCFIGQGCTLGKHYSAENSLFFANSSGFHGEACSVFAGPYTVTHHKSTLLIAGLFSFMNAGSGSNQSNHMYKLGPVHQGIIERGCKTASDSYIQWPAHIGPFTFIRGRHYNNVDTSLFPFSYLIENSSESYLVPAINLKSVGTIRDAQKWPVRDSRKDAEKTDRISFELLNPYTAGKMISGRNILKSLLAETPDAVTFVYDNVKINRPSLERGISLYQAGIIKYLGGMLAKRLLVSKFRTMNELRTLLTYDKKISGTEWHDLAGMIIPAVEVEILLEKLEKDKVHSIQELSLFFDKADSSLSSQEWAWVAARIEEEKGKAIQELTAEDIIGIVGEWKKSVTELDNMLIEDARKEFSVASMTGFGIDGSEEDKKMDFEKVRGDFESNPFVSSIRDHLKTKSAQGNELIKRLKEVV